MHIAVEGCCHGELDAIYASLARAERERGVKVDLLLICGDFQALRNPHDFDSLAVPHKFRNLGSFHSYYSGEKTAPMLTIIIGGNHEASNYMWELYHGGWVAPNIYYLGTAGSVLVNGLRISGASGIYKSHDYYKGFFETLPYDRSTLRSCYHIRHHSVTKLMLLPPSPSPALPPPQHAASPFPPSPHPYIFLSHDWPLSIAPHGDLPALLRRKPFFADEIRADTLGSKPLRDVLRVLQPKWWFAAHLHVKFAAVWKHGEAGDRQGSQQQGQVAPTPAVVKNPDEIDLDDDDDNDAAVAPAPAAAPATNPDEINLDDDDDDDEQANVEPPTLPPAPATDAAADKVEAAETAELVRDGARDEVVLERDADDGDAEVDEEPAGHTQARVAALAGRAGLPAKPQAAALPAAESDMGGSKQEASGAEQEEGVTRFLALDKCMPNKDFLQILDIPFPIESVPGTGPSLTFDPHWLAITRALHPYLSLAQHGARMPDMPELKAAVEREMRWVEERGLGLDAKGEGKVKVEDVQRFWKTAPCVGEPGGGPAAWYTNPQTVAFCDMLDIPNKINPFPADFPAPPLPYPSPFSAPAPAAADEAAAAAAAAAANPDEIMLDDDDDDGGADGAPIGQASVHAIAGREALEDVAPAVEREAEAAVGAEERAQAPVEDVPLTADAGTRCT